jgi:hypothetical protein
MVDLPPPLPPTAEEPPQPPKAAEEPAAAQPPSAVEQDVVEEAAPTSKRAAYRATEIVDQIHQVQEWLTQGKRPNQIRALCAEHWGLKTRSAEQRIQDARRQMVADANVMDRPEKVGQMLQQLEQVLEQALAMKQGSNAIGALRLQADLLQLLARQN